MKKGLLAMALCLAAAVLLAACGGGAASSSVPEEGSSAPPESASTAESAPESAAQSTGFEMLVQDYPEENGAGLASAIEVPAFTGDSPVIEELNAAILEFAGDYEPYLGEGQEDSSLELKTYADTSGDYVQLIMTRITYPIYGTQGQVASFIYDPANDAALGPTDAMQEYGLDEETLKQAFIDAGLLYPSFVVQDFTVEACRFVEGGCELYFNYTYDNPESTPGEGIVTYNSVDEAFYNYTQLFIDPRELDHLDPPLYYDQLGLPDVEGEWVCTNIETQEPESTLLFSADGTVVYEDLLAGTQHEGTYSQRANLLVFTFDDLGEIRGSATADTIFMDNELGGSNIYERA